MNFFIDLQNIVMDYSKIEAKTFIEKLKKRKTALNIMKMTKVAGALPVTSENLGAFYDIYHTTDDKFIIDNLSFEEDEFTHEKIICIEMTNKTAVIGFKGAYDPNYMSLYFSNKDANDKMHLGRIDLPGELKYVGNSKMKEEVVSIMAKVVQRTFEYYTELYLDEFVTGGK